MFEDDEASRKTGGESRESKQNAGDSSRRCCRFWGFNLTTLAVVQVPFLAVSAIVSSVLTSQSYNTVPSESWVLVGGITSTSATARVRVPSASLTDRSFAVFTDPTDPSSTTVLEETILASNSQQFIQAVEIPNLENNTRYYYSIDGVQSGSFQTPGKENEPFNFRFVVAGCAWTGSTHSIFTQMAQEDPLLFLQIGDIHYEDISANDLGLRISAIDRVMGSPTQARLYSSAALAYMWDDHDWLGNDSEGEGEGREAALRSYQLAFPYYTPLPDNSSTPLPSPYHAFTIGTVRFVLMDLRSQASDTSIYSQEQKDWLFRELAASPDYDFIVLISTKPWIDVASNTQEDDGWAGYPDDRSELSSYISSMTKKNLLMIASDAHMVAFDDGSNTYYGNDTTESTESFPLLQSGPMDRLGSTKGGPFTDGCHTVKYERNHQYSVVEFVSTPASGEGGSGASPCLNITAKDSSGNPYLTRTLCGTDIFRNLTSQGSGSCSASTVSTSTTAMLGATCALLVLTGLVSLKFIGCCVGLTTFVISIVLTAATFGIGIGIPLSKNIKQFDTQDIGIVVVTQTVVVFLYVLVWARASKVRRSREDDESNK